MEKNLIFLTILLISFSVEGLCAVRTAVFNPWTGKYDYVGGGVGDIVASGTSGSVLYIDSNGNLAQDNTNLFWDATNHRLGIGTTVPSRKLVVQDTSNTQLLILNIATNSNAGIILQGNATGGTTWNLLSDFPNAGDFDIREVGIADYLTIKKTTGNVGIGTANPIARLEVRDSTANGQAAAVYQNATSGTVFALVVQANGSATTAVGGQFDAIGGTNNRAIQTTTDTVAGANNYSIYSNSPAQSYFNGNVGIGTAGPHALLEVAGTTFINTTAQESGISSAKLVVAQTAATADWTASIKAGTTSGSSYGLQIRAGTTSGDVALAVRDVTNTNDYFRVLGNGNVGIGTTGPGATLHLGTANAILRVGANASVVEIEPNRLLSYNRATPGYLAMNYDALSHAFKISGTEKVTIDTSGNVGIGTTGPQASLHVSGGGGYFGELQTTRTGAGSVYLKFANSLDVARGYIGFDPTTSYFEMNANGNNLVLNASGGNVGIGTTSPGYKLDISGGNVRLSNNTSIIFLTTGGANGSALNMSSADNLSVGQTNANFGGLNLYGGTGNTTIFAGPTTVATFNTSGNVGIGTTGPGDVLHVKAKGQSLANGGIEVEESGTTNPSVYLMYGGAGFGGTLRGYKDGGTTIGMQFLADGNSYFNGGNVGIGTVSPTNILSFGGNTTRTLWMERHTTANTAGNSLSVQAGGATAGATDKNGGALILSPGVSTGTGIVSVNIKGYTQATTGTSDNTQIDRQIVGNVKTLANNTNTAMVNCTIANGTVIAGVLRYAIEVTDGTDYQVEEGMISYHVTNKAGVLANNTVVKFGNQQAMTAGTLTVTFTITAANPAVLTLNANSSLTPSAGYPKVTYTIDNLTSQALAIV